MNDMNDNTIQRMEKILISPNKSKKNTLEKIVIVFLYDYGWFLL